jgi:hypothetical protein
MLPCEVDHFRHFRVGNIVWIYPADAVSRIMDLQHNPSGGFPVLKKILSNT